MSSATSSRNTGSLLLQQIQSIELLNLNLEPNPATSNPSMDESKDTEDDDIFFDAQSIMSYDSDDDGNIFFDAKSVLPSGGDNSLKTQSTRLDTLLSFLSQPRVWIHDCVLFHRAFFTWLAIVGIAIIGVGTAYQIIDVRMQQQQQQQSHSPPLLRRGSGNTEDVPFFVMMMGLLLLSLMLIDVVSALPIWTHTIWDRSGNPSVHRPSSASSHPQILALMGTTLETSLIIMVLNRIELSAEWITWSLEGLLLVFLVRIYWNFFR